MHSTIYRKFSCKPRPHDTRGGSLGDLSWCDLRNSA